MSRWFSVWSIAREEKGAFFISSLETKLEGNKKGSCRNRAASNSEGLKKARVFPLLKTTDISHNTDTCTYR